MIMSLSQLTKCYCGLLRRVAAIGVTTTTTAIYEYRDIWAEESGAANGNSAEWSFGNGATGFIGLPFDAGWEVTHMYFHGDTFATNASISVDLMNYGNVPSNAGANTIAGISLANAADGGGGVNNAYKFFTLIAPVAIPVGVIGFITRASSGNISDIRVGARMRRKVADVVTSVNLA